MIPIGLGASLAVIFTLLIILNPSKGNTFALNAFKWFVQIPVALFVVACGGIVGAASGFTLAVFIGVEREPTSFKKYAEQEVLCFQGYTFPPKGKRTLCAMEEDGRGTYKLFFITKATPRVLPVRETPVVLQVHKTSVQYRSDISPRLISYARPAKFSLFGFSPTERRHELIVPPDSIF